MNGFACNGTLQPAPAPAPEPAILNDGWFPAIDPAQLRAEHRLKDNVTPERLRSAVLAAMVFVRINLRAWKAEQIAAGYASLADVPSEPLDGGTLLGFLYARAIGAEAKAALVEKYRDFDQTGAGQREVGELDSSIGELRRDAIHAIRDILAETRTNVELL